ncbi:hypothetical protein KM1_015460 [Entamoeba histolytica HM-3:IMSS]|uniref:Uncharacterized protein n=1 Tax=Entamoeba histolytica HM-3:IMSS TaxID=885315 RepID=M7W6N8_ENTHI|nr:hypothetical protein KM1_015460 [Entamoeba histolytica HM-3:IMSS]
MSEEYQVMESILPLINSTQTFASFNEHKE